jgi:O-antigen ligase
LTANAPGLNVNMYLIFLFGIIISLSPMTGLRGEQTVSGIDIVMVLLAIVVLPICLRQAALPTTARHPQALQNLYLQPVPQFLLLSTPLLLATTLMNIGELHMQYNPLGRDALSLGAAIISALGICACLASTYRKAFMLGFVLGTAMAMSVYVGMILAGAGYNVDGRFIGASLNPNQVALQSLAAMIICYLVISKMPPGWLLLKCILSFTICLSLIAGIASASDAFRGAGLIVIAAIIFGLFEKLFGNKVRAMTGMLFFGLAGFGVIMWSDPRFIADTWTSMVDAATFGNQDSDRLMLWENGIAAWLENPFFGNGIGAWSGAAGPFQGIEAHNSFIDWISISGAFGGIVYAVLLLKIFRFPFKREPVRYGFFFAIVFYVFFGFFFRNPIYWLVMAVILDGYDTLQQSTSLHRNSAKTPKITRAYHE